MLELKSSISNSHDIAFAFSRSWRIRSVRWQTKMTSTSNTTTINTEHLYVSNRHSSMTLLQLNVGKVQRSKSRTRHNTRSSPRSIGSSDSQYDSRYNLILTNTNLSQKIHSIVSDMHRYHNIPSWRSRTRRPLSSFWKIDENSWNVEKSKKKKEVWCEIL